jgi:hypothetical protein
VALLCAAAMVFSGCADGSPTEATDPAEHLAVAAPASRHVLVATAAELQAFGEAVEDMRSRVLPTLAAAARPAATARPAPRAHSARGVSTP